MTQAERAKTFMALHRKGDPVILYNIWDAGSAKAVEAAGAKALATGSWSVAAAHGFADGESIPLDLVETIVARITASTELPLTVDFEGGYAAEPAAVAENAARLITSGAIGFNFEDRIVGGEGLYDIEAQGRRIAAIRDIGAAWEVPLVLNARTDLFLQADSERHASLLDDAKARAAAYAAAGADSFFVPGLTDEELIGEICDACVLPVNVMVMDTAPSIGRLAELGVGRISFGPAPFRLFKATLQKQAQEIYGGK